MERIFQPWWGEYRLENRQTGCWRIGPLSLWIQPQHPEWRIAYRSSTDLGLTDIEINVPCGQEIPAGVENLLRFGFSAPGNWLKIQPMLADRPVISRPGKPLFLPPGEAITLYVSSPLWLRVQAGERRSVLSEFPVHQPSDTWFGSPMDEDGYSYSAVTRALTSLQDFPYSPVRAVTPVVIRNVATNILPIERLNLPVPFLSLYEAENGSLWTQSVTLEREEDDGELALLKLGRTLPEFLGQGRLLAEPRQHAEKNLVFQAFSRFFI